MNNSRTKSSAKWRPCPDQMQSHHMQLNLEKVEGNYSHYFTGVLNVFTQIIHEYMN